MLLLDTHVVIWLMNSPERISLNARRALQEAAENKTLPAISAVSIYEIFYAARRGRLQIHLPEAQFLALLQDHFEILPVSAAIAATAATFPESLHRDPMDRMIAATALIHKKTLLSRDERFRETLLCPTLW